ncbi:terpene synthase [Suillus ampliporus]|nr:terpene synthase [Suillus ampliporus]
MALTATHTTTRSDFEPTEFVLPDLLSDCHYPLRVNPHCHPVSRASEQWLFTEACVVEPEMTKFRSLPLGDCTAACYPDADASHLRVCVDVINWSFTLDDRLDDGDIDDARGMRECCISAFRDPINFQTEKPDGNMRDLSDCRTCFLIEYAGEIDLPDEVVSHSAMMAMEEATVDNLAWCNDIYSYNKEQSRHDASSLIAVLMHDQGLDLQGAVDYSGEPCKSAMQRFEDNRAILPSWGTEVDRQVVIYVQGLQDLMVGSLHWYFESTRYFGKDGHTM